MISWSCFNWWHFGKSAGRSTRICSLTSVYFCFSAPTSVIYVFKSDLNHLQAGQLIELSKVQDPNPRWVEENQNREKGGGNSKNFLLPIMMVMWNYWRMKRRNIFLTPLPLHLLWDYRGKKEIISKMTKKGSDRIILLHVSWFVCSVIMRNDDLRHDGWLKQTK